MQRSIVPWFQPGGPRRTDSTSLPSTTSMLRSDRNLRMIFGHPASRHVSAQVEKLLGQHKNVVGGGRFEGSWTTTEEQQNSRATAGIQWAADSEQPFFIPFRRDRATSVNLSSGSLSSGSSCNSVC